MQTPVNMAQDQDAPSKVERPQVPAQLAQVETWKSKFDSYVTKGSPDECWEWRGPRTGGGYGIAQCNGLRLSAHRVSVMLHIGDIPEGMLVLHKCDNPPCCNPAHLSVGTYLDNTEDCINKGRSANQRRSYAVALEASKVELITTGRAAAMAGVSGQTIINWANEGRFPAPRVGRGPRKIPLHTFKEYLKSAGFTFPNEQGWAAA